MNNNNGNNGQQQQAMNGQGQEQQNPGQDQQAAAPAAVNPYYRQQPQQVPQVNPYYQVPPMANPYYQQSSYTTTSSWMGNTPGEKFVRGLVIGAAATYLLTNDTAQKAILKTGMKLYGAVAGGVEELKEKIMDAKAEVEEEMQQES